MKRFRFNMVEIVVAMVIILVTLVGILSLLPHSIEANQNAINRSAAADAADQFMQLVGSRIERNWIECEAFPSAKPTQDSDNMIFSAAGLMDQTNLRISFEAPNETAEWDGNSPEDHNTGIFRVTQASGTNLTDFQGEIRAWKEVYEVGPGGEKRSQTKNGGQGTRGDDFDPEDWKRNGKAVIAHTPSDDSSACHTLVVDESELESGGSFEGADVGPCLEDLDADGNLSMRALTCTLNIEVSWPLSVPYDQREKVVYQREIAKPVTILPPAEAVAATETEEETTEETTEETEEETDLFEIEDGEVIVNEDTHTTFKNLGCAFSWNGTAPISCKIIVDNQTYEPFGDADNWQQGDINDGQQHDYDAGILAAGTAVSCVGISWKPYGNGYTKHLTINSTPSNQNVLVLRDGDSVPDIEGYKDQEKVEKYLQEYIDTDTKTVTLQPNQAILLFELGTTDMSASSADFQDMVMLVTMTPEE